jgi:hypothetical protein
MLSAAWITARDLVGGLVIAIGLGSAVDRLGEPLLLSVRRTISSLVAMAVLVIAGRLWARHMTQLAGSARLSRRNELITALTFGATFIIIGLGLALLEPVMVERGLRSGFGIHVVYSLLFVPTAFIVATIGAASLRMSDGSRMIGMRSAVVAGLCAAIAFLLVDLAMDAAGWRVGGPNAGKRATMLVVTFVSATAAALGGGAAIGWRISKHEAPVPSSVEQ